MLSLFFLVVVFYLLERLEDVFGQLLDPVAGEGEALEGTEPHEGGRRHVRHLVVVQAEVQEASAVALEVIESVPVFLARARTMPITLVN